MNKRGQTIFISLMLGVVCFWLGLSLAFPMSRVVQDSRGQMNCTNATEYIALDYQGKANCVAIDVLLPLLVGTLFGIAGFIIGGRI